MEVRRTYLEMGAPGALRAVAPPEDGVRVEEARGIAPSFYRYLYREVGAAYHWLDRARWTDDEIRAALARPGLSLHVLYVTGAPAGYFELLRHEPGDVEIVYFGLLPEYHGRRLGGYLLSEAVLAAWRRDPPRVWLHTCSLDGPAALPNYLARGFVPFREETYTVDLPAPPSDEAERPTHDSRLTD